MRRSPNVASFLDGECRGFRLRQFDLERVDLVATQATPEESGIVGSKATPRTKKRGSLVGSTVQNLQIDEKFRAGLSDSDTAISGIFRRGIFVVNVPSIPRPSGVEHGPGFINPICPLLGLEVEEQELPAIHRDCGQMLAIRRPARSKHVFRAGNWGNLLRVEIQNLNSDFLCASLKPGNPPKGKLFAIRRPTWIQLMLVFREHQLRRCAL